MAHDVFISHSAKDKVTADAVCAMLESNGIRCWIAPRDVLPSMEWGEAIVEAIEQARIMVLVFTANANASPQIRREVERAVNRGVAILPLRMEDVLPGKSLEYFIGNVHWLDALTPPIEAHLKGLAGTIKILLARGEPGAPPPMPPEEKPPLGSSHGAAGRIPMNATVREKAPAAQPFWSARSWTWAGSVAALLLVGVFIGVHFSSHPAPVVSPGPVGTPSQTIPGTAAPGGSVPLAPEPAGVPKPAAKTPGAAPGSAPSLRDAMSTIQKELSSIGTVSYTAFIRNNTAGSNSQNTGAKQISNVVADPAQCRVSYHLKIWRGGAVASDKDAWFALPAVTSVLVESESQFLTQQNAAAGHSDVVVNSTNPPVVALIVRRGSVYNGLPFANAALANRATQSIEQAVRLCGGHLAN